jgi:hypothetical protein
VPVGKRGQTPAGFRAQLLQRLRNTALQEGIPAQSLQQRIAFERFLARLPQDGTWVLKGGFALQLRYGLQTRPTKDVDIRTALDTSEALQRLRQLVARSELTDHFAFDLGDPQELTGAPGGTLRLGIGARLAGLEFAKFHLDLSSGDALVGPPELFRGSGLLEFAGILPITFPIYPIAQHLAEKLHAYTLPRTQENTRVKDLVDFGVIITSEQITSESLMKSVAATFQTRQTHVVPSHLPEPSSSWSGAFSAIAATVNLPVAGLSEGFKLAADFWDPFLSARAPQATWLPRERCWWTPIPPPVTTPDLQTPPDQVE